jgi:hypothetical protein
MKTKVEKQNLLNNYFTKEFNEGERYPFPLKNEIINEISPEEFYPLINDLYDSLNEKYDFDNSAKNRSTLMFATIRLAEGYERAERARSENKALKSTLLFCLFIITIPFSLWYYRKKTTENYAQQHFQTVFVDDSLIKVIRQSKKEEHSYGLINKSIKNDNQEEPKPFKSVFFNSKGQVRKFMPSSESGFFGRYGINLVGTSEQISSFKEKSYAAIETRNSL